MALRTKRLRRSTPAKPKRVSLARCSGGLLHRPIFVASLVLGVVQAEGSYPMMMFFQCSRCPVALELGGDYQLASARLRHPFGAYWPVTGDPEPIAMRHIRRAQGD